MPQVEIVRGSLLDQEVKAIVNAANTSMRGGSGIDGAVHRAAGPGLIQELMMVAPHGAKTGQVVVTGGHNTSFKRIFHVAGPVWNGGGHGAEQALTECYVNACMKGIDLEIDSIGFCSISTGIYRFPLDIAAPIAIASTRALRNSPVKRVVFAMFQKAEFEAFRSAYKFASQSGTE